MENSRRTKVIRKCSGVNENYFTRAAETKTKKKNLLPVSKRLHLTIKTNRFLFHENGTTLYFITED